jgi:Phosphorylase superfamily
MATAELPWLFVAAEAREFDGLIERLGPAKPLDWPEAAFAREIANKSQRWWLISNGPGEALVTLALSKRREIAGLVSTGFCGALDQALHLGDIVVSGEAPQTKNPFVSGALYTSPRVVVTAREKSELSSKAIAVDMEAAAVERKAREWGVPFRCVRVVSDEAQEDLPLDFNLYLDKSGRFDRGRIARAALIRPFTLVPALLRLDKNCRNASRKLGAFFADCRF